MNLVKGKKEVLTIINKIAIQLNWTSNYDVDIVVFAVDEKNQIIETFCYQNLAGAGIEFLRDDTFLELPRNFEYIHFDFRRLKKFNEKIDKFYICAVSKSAFSEVEKFEIKIFDAITDTELLSGLIENIKDSSSVHICNLKKGVDWELELILEPLNGQIGELRDILTD